MTEKNKKIKLNSIDEQETLESFYKEIGPEEKKEIHNKLSEERKEIFNSINEDSKELSDNLDFEEKIELQFTKDIKVSWKFTKAKKEVIEKQTKESDVEIARKFIEESLNDE